MNDLKKNLKILLVNVFLFLGACVSDKEKTVRRENAFDINGSYRAELGGRDGLNFQIINEKGHHDIVIKLNREGHFKENEKKFLARLEQDHGIKINDNMLFEKSKKIILGKGYFWLNDVQRGGENISDNFGKTSKFFVCSRGRSIYRIHKDLAFFSSLRHLDEQSKDAIRSAKLVIKYCLSGEVKKEVRNVIKGQLQLIADIVYKKGGFDFGVAPAGRAEVEYRAILGQ